MLLGPSLRLDTFQSDRGNANSIEGIRRYLEELGRNLKTHYSTIVTNTVGMIGVRGLSGTGVAAQNFVKVGLAIGGQTTAAWLFSSAESDISYMLLYTPSASTGMVITQVSKQTTQALFSFNPTVPSGMLLDILLLR